MAELVLSTLGRAVGARVAPTALRSAVSALGQAAGASLGRSIDQRVFGPSQRIEGARLTDLHLQASSEGASIPVIYGRVRLAGQVIWAARFKERATTTTTQSGGKGGGRVTRTDYTYSLSFAVGLCEGKVARIARAWANGEAFDLGAVNWRLHVGGEDQLADPLIEAIEGSGAAPAYRGLSYIVFEDLPLERFGNVIPQVSFEIVRPTPSPTLQLEDMARGVCLIPGSGEFVYATDVVRRSVGPGKETTENAHAEPDRANFEVALDQLAAELPNLQSVMLVVSWFGTDLRCGQCAIKPGVEIAAKDTTPQVWRVNGATRSAAHLVSQFGGGPAFGGTPNDKSVMQAIQALKARGYRVGLYPFIQMDIPPGNALPDPYGGAEQSAYPWRGRIALHPAPGQPGSPDKTAAATAQLNAFIGAASLSHFGADANGTTYAGPAEYSFRRFILHHAKLAQAAGGVDAFVLGSELRGLSTARDGAASFPVVAALQALAADVRAMLGPSTTLTYAADWSEYRGHQPADGTGDVYFHLDPLWADANIDCVGVDWYPPLTDWRDGSTHLDAQTAPSIYDAGYLESRIESGESFDWYYADDAARAAQTRSNITDGAYAKPWVYRAKDLRSFWLNAHYNRPAGVESATPTAWTPQSKPIWLMELGCAAIDKGANAPNLFLDAKSSENAAPYFSSGARDDVIQRRALEAYLRYWDASGANNPVSAVYAGPMLDMDNAHIWCWDARPYPAFPARADVWADGDAWRRGHWLSGRAGLGDLAAVVRDICAGAGLNDVNADALAGAVAGYVLDSPARARDALEPLLRAYDFDVAEQSGVLTFRHRGLRAPVALSLGDCVDGVETAFAERGDAAETPIEARVRFLDQAQDYRVSAVSARRQDAADGGVVQIDAPLVLDADQALRIAERALSDARIARETLTIALPPQALVLEAGDTATLDAIDGVFEIVETEEAETRTLALRRASSPGAPILHGGETIAPPVNGPAPKPDVAVLDLPLLPGSEADERPLIAVYADPWRGPHDIVIAEVVRGRARAPAAIGRLLWDLYPGPVGRWDEGNRVRASFPSAALAGVTKDAALNGANAFAVEGAGGLWEIVQARDIVLTGPGEYELSGFLRGLLGSEAAMGAPTPAGARIVRIDATLARVDVLSHEWRESLQIVVAPFDRAPTDPAATIWDGALQRIASKAYAPAHLRARRLASGDIAVSWVRCARIGGDAWSAGEPPLGAVAERYRIEVFDGATLKRAAETTAPAWTYAAADQAADFGGPAAAFTIRAAQIGDDGLHGFAVESLFAL